MRTELSSLFPSILGQQPGEMAKETKDTVACANQQEHPKTVFSAADLWNIQRIRKQRVQRRLIF